MNARRSHPLVRRAVLPLIGVLALTIGASACGDDDGDSDSLTVYSGRSEELVGPLLDQFESSSGIDVNVRYGDSAEVALLVQQEGEASPADAIITQSPTPLSILDADGLLAELPNDLFSRVPAAFRDADGANWMGISGRNRVLVINTESVDPAEIPGSVFGLADERFAGRVAVAPENGSFQEFVAVAVAERGADEVGEWLSAMADNDTQGYPKNSAIVDAVGRGEIDMGLVNNYYVARALAESPDLPIAIVNFPADDVGSLVLPSSGAVLASSDNATGAEDLLSFLTEDSAQQYLADENQEYPLAGSNAVTLDDAFPFPGTSADLAEVVNLISESGIGQ